MPLTVWSKIEQRIVNRMDTWAHKKWLCSKACNSFNKLVQKILGLRFSIK